MRDLGIKILSKLLISDWHAPQSKDLLYVFQVKPDWASLLVDLRAMKPEDMQFSWSESGIYLTTSELDKRLGPSGTARVERIIAALQVPAMLLQ
jgi:hypothetical protein